jgi:3-deoxy-D-manno-octulosonic-acid transferase
MILIYEFLGYVLVPIIKINLWLRIIQKKEDKKRYKERFGCSKVIKLCW